MKINVALVHQLVAAQFPQWADLPIKPVESGGWDNRTFHLGADMTVRLPSAEGYALQVEKEHRWLPRLAPLLPLPIPVPLATLNHGSAQFISLLPVQQASGASGDRLSCQSSHRRLPLEPTYRNRARYLAQSAPATVRYSPPSVD